MLGDSKIEQLYNQIMSIFDFDLTDKRSTQLKQIYELQCNESNLPLVVCSPKFSHVHLGYCYVGGNLEYIVNLKQIANDLYDTYTKNDISITDINGNLIDKKFITFYVLLSAIGSFGRGNQPYYVENKVQYQVKSGKHYIINPNLPYMTVSDNLILLATQYGIALSETEYIMLKSINYDYASDGKVYMDKFDFDYQLNATFPHLMLSAVRLALLKGKHNYYNYYAKSNAILTNNATNNNIIKPDKPKDTFLDELNGISSDPPKQVQFTDWNSPELDSKSLGEMTKKSEKKIQNTLNNERPKQSPDEVFDRIFGL